LSRQVGYDKIEKRLFYGGLKMNKESIKLVKEEIKRFNKCLAKVESRMEKDSYVFYGCKETGALKRASMDLSNALVSLRRSN